MSSKLCFVFSQLAHSCARQRIVPKPPERSSIRSIASTASAGLPTMAPPRATVASISCETFGSDGRPSVFSKYSSFHSRLRFATSANASSRLSATCIGITSRQSSREIVFPAAAAASSAICHVVGGLISPPGCETATERMPTPCFPAEVGPDSENMLATAAGMCEKAQGASWSHASRSVNQSDSCVTVSPRKSARITPSASSIRCRCVSASIPII